MGKPQGGLKPWREVVTPHPDVAKGTYQQAEFAADLWQADQGAGADGTNTRVFRRMLIRGSGDPVVELQANFGGGKTHKSPRPSGERSAEPGLGVDRAQRLR